MLLFDLPFLCNNILEASFHYLIMYSTVDKVHIQPVSQRGRQLSILKSQTSILNSVYTLPWSLNILVPIWLQKCIIISVVFPGGSVVKNLPAVQVMQIWSLGQEELLKKEMATYSNIVVQEIPWTEEAGRLQKSTGSQTVGQDLVAKQQQHYYFLVFSWWANKDNILIHFLIKKWAVLILWYAT